MSVTVAEAGTTTVSESGRLHRYSSAPMNLILAAKPWTYWLAPVLTLVAVLGLIGVILGYLVKVVAAKYPKT
jgi:hypothetical protein